MTRENPYNRLKRIGQEFFYKFVDRKRKSMWFYPKDRLNQGWKLYDLYERTAAANQLGYSVELIAEEDGLYVKYVQKPPTRLPWEFR